MGGKQPRNQGSKTYRKRQANGAGSGVGADGRADRGEHRLANIADIEQSLGSFQDARGFIGGRTLYTTTQLDLLSVDRTTNLDAVSFQFGFTPVRMASALDYLR